MKVVRLLGATFDGRQGQLYSVLDEEETDRRWETVESGLSMEEAREAVDRLRRVRDVLSS